MGSINGRLIARAKAVKILKKIPLFQGLIEAEYHTVLAMSRSIIINKGDTLFRQGDDGDGMFVLLSGEVEIIIEDIGSIHVMQAGEVVGEIGLIKRVPRTASAIVIADCVLLRFRSGILHEVVKKQPRIGYIIMRNVARILADRLSQSNSGK